MGHPAASCPSHLQLFLGGVQEEERGAALANVHKVDDAGGNHEVAWS